MIKGSIQEEDIMIKGTIQEGDITIVNIYAPNTGAPQYIRQTLTDINGEIDSNIIIVRDFNMVAQTVTCLPSMWETWVQYMGREDPLEKVPCALENKVYSSAFGWNILRISMRSFSSNVSFKTCISLLIFFFDEIGVSEVLNKLLCYCQFLLFCLLVFVLCIEVLLCWVHRYLQLLYLPLGLIL